jgi:hypothetical protein
MKPIQRNLFLAAAVVTVLNFQSCGKYEDGPGFSLRSKTARLTGEWEVVRVGATSYPHDGYSVEFEFEKSGDFSQTVSEVGYGSYSYTGDWEFASDKENLEIIVDGALIDFEIKRLTNEELWLEDEFNQEWRLEAK